MKITGIATDLTLDLTKTEGFNFVAPVIENDGKYYIQRFDGEDFNYLLEMVVSYADDDEDIEEIINNYLKMTKKELKDIGSAHNRKYKLVEYEPDFGNMDFLKKRDETFHIEPDLDINPESLILGISFDDDIFIGSPSFIISQLELLVGDELTVEEMDILYRAYGMSEQFDKMEEMIDKALDSPLEFGDFLDWQHRKKHHEIELKLEGILNSRKGKTYELKNEEE